MPIIDGQSERSTAALRLIYLANFVVVGAMGIMSLFLPALATTWIFGGTAHEGFLIQIAGAFWCAIAVLSVPGLFFPLRFSPVLLVQLITNLLWLVIVALPTIFEGSSNNIPAGMAVFFLTWLVILPMVIPFDYLFKEG